MDIRNKSRSAKEFGRRVMKTSAFVGLVPVGVAVTVCVNLAGGTSPPAATQPATQATSRPAADLDAMARLLSEKLGGKWEKGVWKNKPAPGQQVEYLWGTIRWSESNTAFNNGNATVNIYPFPPTGDNRKVLRSIYETMQVPFAIVGASSAATALVPWADPNCPPVVKLREALGMSTTADAGKWVGALEADEPAAQPTSAPAK